MKKEKYLIIEVDNPEYKEVKRKNAAFSPQPKSIKISNLEPQKSLAEQIKDRERRHKQWLGENNLPNNDCE
jgi:hypothetical protein